MVIRPDASQGREIGSRPRPKSRASLATRPLYPEEKSSSRQVGDLYSSSSATRSGELADAPVLPKNQAGIRWKSGTPYNAEEQLGRHLPKTQHEASPDIGPDGVTINFYNITPRNMEHIPISPESEGQVEWPNWRPGNYKRGCPIPMRLNNTTMRVSKGYPGRNLGAPLLRRRATIRVSVRHMCNFRKVQARILAEEFGCQHVFPPLLLPSTYMGQA